MFDMRLKLVSNALSKKNWCAAGHELIDLVALDDLSISIRNTYKGREYNCFAKLCFVLGSKFQSLI